MTNLELGRLRLAHQARLALPLGALALLACTEPAGTETPGSSTSVAGTNASAGVTSLGGSGLAGGSGGAESGTGGTLATTMGGSSAGTSGSSQAGASGQAGTAGAGSEPDPNTCQLFLLGGQSNMEGNVDAELFASLLKELAAPPASTAQARLAASLNNWYQTWNDGYASYGATPEILSYEAGELIRMQTDGLVGDQLAAPRSDVWCSWETRGEAAKAGALEPGKCGNVFGPELALGHFLGQKWTAPISFVKVAHGGTTLEADWLSTNAAKANGREVGSLYEQLTARIRSLSNDKSLLHPDCATRPLVWSAFVWFQGENDTFSPTGSTEYESNLRALISDVRAEIGAPSLPVIIVQIGRWAHTADSEGGAKVYDAQAKVVSTTPGASLVVTDDLSGFYHYDSAAQLIVGERVARSLP